MPTDTRPWNCDDCKWCVARGCNEHEDKTGPYKPPPRLPNDTRPDPIREALDVLKADAHDENRAAMWRYGVRHTLSVIEAALASGAVTEGLDDLRAAVELADTRTDDSEVGPDGTVAEYVLSATDWNRVVAIARGSKSEAAERAIAPFRARLSGATDRPREQRLREVQTLVGLAGRHLLGDADVSRDDAAAALHEADRVIRAALSEPET